jgi:Ala-tRNA(Pro) deacylase
MGISPTVRYFLDRTGVRYTLIPHPRAYSSMETAEAAHVPGAELAKSVVIEANGAYAVVVLPSTHQVDFETLAGQIGHPCALAAESETRRLFADCETGSIPPVGQAYGVPVWVDEAILDQAEVYFEGGDHTELVRLSGEDFGRLMAEARHGAFSRHI